MRGKSQKNSFLCSKVFSNLNRMELEMKKLLLASLIFSSLTGAAIAEDVKYQPTEREIQAFRVLLEDDINGYLDGNETALGGVYEENERVKGLKAKIPAESILKTYGENEVRGDKQYKGKEFIVSGTIKSIDSGMGDEPFITFATKDKYSFNSVQARFKKSDQEKLIDLNKGQKVEIYCRGAGEVAGSPMLNNCQFVDKKGIVKEVVESYVQQTEKLKLGNVADVHEGIRMFALILEAAAKKTNDFAGCKKEIEMGCLVKSINSAFKKGKGNISSQIMADAEYAPLVEYLQLKK